jgi:hypothetical protein
LFYRGAISFGAHLGRWSAAQPDLKFVKCPDFNYKAPSLDASPGCFEALGLRKAE